MGSPRVPHIRDLRRLRLPRTSSAPSAGDKGRRDPGPPRRRGPGQARGAEATPQAPGRGTSPTGRSPSPAAGRGRGFQSAPRRAAEKPSCALRGRGGPVSQAAASQAAAGGRASASPGRSEAPPSPWRAPVAPQSSSPLAAAPRPHPPPRALPGAPLTSRTGHPTLQRSARSPQSPGGRSVREALALARAPPPPSEQGASEGVAGAGDGGEPARRSRLDSRSPLPAPVAPTPARPPAGNAPRPRAVPGY